MSIKNYALFICGQIGLMLLARYFFQWIIAFAALESGASGILFSATAVGALLIGMRIFDGVTDPIAGALSDGWLLKGKKRQQLLWFWFLVPALGLVLCFVPSHEMSTMLRWVFLTFGMLLFFIGYTFYGIPYWSLVGDYSAGSTKYQRMLSTLLGAGLLIATAIGFIVTPMLVEQYGFFHGAIILAVVAAMLMPLPYFAAPTSEPPLVAPTEVQPVTLQTVFLALSNRTFLSVLMIFVGSQMALTIMTAAAPFVAIDLLGGSASDVAMLLGPFLLVAIVSFFLVPHISRRFGWQKAIVGAGVSLGLVFTACFFLGATFFGSPLLTASIVFSAGGPMIAVLLGLEGEAITSTAFQDGAEGSVGRYFGIYNLVVKAFNGVAIFLTGVFADLSRGSWGNLGIRAMIASAGISLFLGVLLYFLLRPRRFQYA